MLRKTFKVDLKQNSLKAHPLVRVRNCGYLLNFESKISVFI